MLLNLGKSLPPASSRIANIPDGVAGVRATLELMAKLARAGKKQLPVRLAALQITQRLPQRGYSEEVAALHAFVRDRIRYVQDVRGVETLQDPVRTLQLRAGDCDDKSVLLAALLESIGHPARFVAVGFRPGEWSHVYVETRAGLRGRRGRSIWLPLETCAPDFEPGEAPAGVRQRMVWYV